MGRRIVKGPTDYEGRLSLSRVRMSACGAYDSNGTYFGCGQPLYWYAAVDDVTGDSDIDGVLRAIDRVDARRQVLQLYPKARVRR